jgi:hypothetical protein
MKNNIFQNLHRFCGPLLILIFFIAYPSDGLPESQRELVLEDMTDMADEIVVGKVIANESHWQGKLIVTVSTIEVNETVKGQPAPTVEITQFGGTAVHPKLKAPVHMSASASAVLTPGDQVLLFMRKTKSGTRDLIGGSQGKFSVTVDKKTGDRIIPVGPKELAVLKQDGKQTVTHKHVTLNEMRRRIEDRIQKGKMPGK